MTMSGEKGHKYTFRELVSLRRTPEKIKKRNFKDLRYVPAKYMDQCSTVFDIRPVRRTMAG